MIISISAKSQELNYGYDHWPFKDAVSKENIEFPSDLYIKYNMVRLKGTPQKTISMRFIYSMKDTLKHYGNLRIYVKKSVQKAQFDMLSFLNELSAPIPQLTNGPYSCGNVAFGEEKNEIFLLVISRNNVFFWIQAPTEITKEIADRIIKCIDLAPVIKEGPDLSILPQ